MDAMDAFHFFQLLDLFDADSDPFFIRIFRLCDSIYRPIGKGGLPPLPPPLAKGGEGGCDF